MLQGNSYETEKHMHERTAMVQHGVAQQRQGKLDQGHWMAWGQQELEKARVFWSELRQRWFSMPQPSQSQRKPEPRRSER